MKEEGEESFDLLWTGWRTQPDKRWHHDSTSGQGFYTVLHNSDKVQR